jgi:O-acetyl-ADP-ribose deacetylase (regulator of RNase III)
MIKYVKGDILLTKSEALAHGVAPNDDFKQGLALSLREQWPSMYNDFRHFCKSTSPKEGDVWSWKGPGGPVVLNLFTQDAPKTQGSHPGKATEKYVNSSLKNLVKEIKKEKIKSLAITKVATGVGGLSWEGVKPLIEKHLADLETTVYVYENFSKGVQAEEK